MGSDTTRGLDVFSYVTTKETAAVYRGIVGAFMEAKARYRLQMRVADITHALRDIGLEIDEDAATRYLDQLVAWGNLKRQHDTREVNTLADFYRRRSLYQLTPAGEEAHKGVVAVERVMEASGGRLSSVMLPAILERLEAIQKELATPSPDAPRLYTLLKELHGFSSDLAQNARRFMNDLNDSLESLSLTDESFMAYKRAVLIYLQGFVSDLNRYQPRIVTVLAVFPEAKVEHLVGLAATADEAPNREGVRLGPVQELRDRWSALRSWFVGSPQHDPEVDHLRDATLDAISRILRILERLNENRFLRVNRAADLRALARWFASSTDEESHRIYAVAFGLHGPRHLSVAVEDEELCRGKSWWEVEPVVIAPRLRAFGQRSSPGRPGAIPDHSARRAQALVEAREREAAQARALARFVGWSGRFEEIKHLDADQMEVLLVLLDVALRSSSDDGRRDVVTPGGEHRIVLLAPPSNERVSLDTPQGTLEVPNYWIEVSALDARAARRQVQTS